MIPVAAPGHGEVVREREASRVYGYTSPRFDAGTVTGPPASRRKPWGPAPGPPGGGEGRCPHRETALMVAGAAAVAAAVVALSIAAYLHWPPAMVGGRPTPQGPVPDGMAWLGAFTWWDGAWYTGIAERGYGFTAGRQSPVAFFPAYPVMVRALAPVAGSSALSGFAVTLACGLAALVLFHAWAYERAGRRAARYAFAALALYPCSFYLFGTVYADALFLVAAVGAFLLLERDRTVLAGLVAAVGTATRPVGMALAVGLWARVAERRGVLEGGRLDLSRLLARDAGLLLAPLGLVAYAAYLGRRFGEPLLFIEAEKGWGQSPGWTTWLKLSWFQEMAAARPLSPPQLHLVGALLAAAVALGLAVAVFRRLGWGYGVYSLAVVAGSAVSTKNFIGMGRYAMAAFPCFVVAGLMLAGRKRVGWAVLAVSGVMLVVLSQFHARNMLIS